MQDATEFGESWRFSIPGKKVSVVGIDISALCIWLFSCFQDILKLCEQE
jgi:hypothetical protein